MCLGARQEALGKEFKNVSSNYGYVFAESPLLKVESQIVEFYFDYEYLQITNILLTDNVFLLKNLQV